MTRKKDEETLAELRRKFEGVKSRISELEGEKKAVLGQLDREFGIKDTDRAYERLDVLAEKIESKKERKGKLLRKVREMLARYDET